MNTKFVSSTKITRRYGEIIKKTSSIFFCLPHFYILLVLSSPVYLAAWTPVPQGPGAIGQFEWEKVHMLNSEPPNVEYIRIRWKPPANGAPCAKTAIIQTFKWYFEDQIGNKKDIDKPSDIFDGIDWDAIRDPGKSVLLDQKKNREQANDPNVFDGTVVDSSWCDEDPYLNGDDPDEEDMLKLNKQGTHDQPTTIIDSPYCSDICFTGNRHKLVIEFEVCAYCKNEDGTAGDVLDCTTLRYERTKGQGNGTIIPPSKPSKPPSKNHTEAVKKFVSRHTKENKDGTLKKTCPDGIPGMLEELESLYAKLQDANEEEKKELLEQFNTLLQKIRAARGRKQ